MADRQPPTSDEPTTTPDDALTPEEEARELIGDADLPLSEHVRETEFGHPSERVAARILDFYRIRWEYEPTTFPIEWDRAGHVIASFSPDFYLPDFDLYIELTTMSQKLVTKKNRKVRRLRELYPEINIKIFYQKDFRRLLFKFGIPVQERPFSEGGGLGERAPAEQTSERAPAERIGEALERADEGEPSVEAGPSAEGEPSAEGAGDES